MGQRMDKNFKVTAKAEIGQHYCTHPGRIISWLEFNYVMGLNVWQGQASWNGIGPLADMFQGGFNFKITWHNLSRIMTKPTKWHVRPAKTQIRLGGCQGWSESSLGWQPHCWFSHEATHFFDHMTLSTHSLPAGVAHQSYKRVTGEQNERNFIALGLPNDCWSLEISWPKDIAVW